MLLYVFEVKVSSVNVEELELEGCVSLKSRCSISSLEVEHDIEFLSSIDISQESDEVLEEGDTVLTLSSLEMVVDILVVLDSNLLSKAL